MIFRISLCIVFQLAYCQILLLEQYSNSRYSKKKQNSHIFLRLFEFGKEDYLANIIENSDRDSINSNTYRSGQQILREKYKNKRNLYQDTIGIKYFFTFTSGRNNIINNEYQDVTPVSEEKPNIKINDGFFKNTGSKIVKHDYVLNENITKSVSQETKKPDKIRTDKATLNKQLPKGINISLINEIFNNQPNNGNYNKSYATSVPTPIHSNNSINTNTKPNIDFVEMSGFQNNPLPMYNDSYSDSMESEVNNLDDRANLSANCPTGQGRVNGICLPKQK